MDRTSRNVTYQNELVGWTPEGNDRGTWSIIATALVTIVVCTWTVLHPRIHLGRKLRRTHRFCQLVKQVLAPELETIEALQEYLQARKTMRCCAEATRNEMKLMQSFYIGMMGLRYHVGSDGGHCVMWPLQYAYLLNSGLVPWPPARDWDLSVEHVEDKSKADGLLKLVAIWQVLWFTANCITRGAHHLELAPLESMTLAYVVQVILTYCLWWKKPKDISTASLVALPEMTDEQRIQFENLSMEATYDRPDPAADPPCMSIAWYIIPRDCSESAYLIAKAGSQSTTTPRPSSSSKHKDISTEHTEKVPPSPRRAKALHTMIPRTGVKAGGSDPIDTKVITEWDDSLYMTKWWPLVCLLGVSFGAVHMVSWNAIFPTRVELWLWRMSSLGSVVFGLVTMHFKKIAFRWQGAVTIVKLGCPVLYVVCRVAMLAEAIAAFRAMPRSTYQTYEIVNYVF
ncbi:unnamed protein product [Zymoseptoria tritici ST99CH_3D7]|uniref:Uncharacterized protein n=1 Tax=Zymoseptoria tritici (strain ST99CH_3D7) TaxID=1276538 RepID=A0A1X7RWT1_ZYMT9|nr:unnamed protein product [Zymoseptoria tritici ST99CH_3D7]